MSKVTHQNQLRAGLIQGAISGDETWVYTTHDAHIRQVNGAVFVWKRRQYALGFFPEGLTVTEEYYHLDNMRHLYEAIRQKESIFGQKLRRFCTKLMYGRTLSSLPVDF